MYGNQGFGGNRGGSVAPVKVDEEYDVKIEAVGEKGDGIARVKGFVLFVPGTRAGDEVRVRVSRVLAKVGFAESIGKASKPISESQGYNKGSRNENSEQEQPEEQPMEASPEDTEDFGEDEEKTE